MDLTPIYFKMCETAEEVQAMWKPAVSDHIAWRKNVSVIELCNAEEADNPSWKENWIFLPKQDQLQDMMIADCAASLIESFYQWWEKYSQHHYSTSKSMEQLWLIFVMERRFNKFFDGFRWVADPKFEMFDKKENKNED